MPAPTRSSTRSTVRRSGRSGSRASATSCAAEPIAGRPARSASFVITGERSIGSGMRRIEALTGAGADAYLRSRADALLAAQETAGAQTAEQLPDRIRALQEELRETKTPAKSGAAAGGGLPKPGELAAAAAEVAPAATFIRDWPTAMCICRGSGKKGGGWM